jgi:hypothetical protein
VDWTNAGVNAEVTLTPKSFRPNAPSVSDQDDFVLLARDTEASSVLVTWTLTEDGNDEVTTGEMHVPTSDLMEAADLLKEHFLPEG